jgi:hypothetical protein
MAFVSVLMAILEFFVIFLVKVIVLLVVLLMNALFVSLGFIYRVVIVKLVRLGVRLALLITCVLLASRIMFRVLLLWGLFAVLSVKLGVVNVMKLEDVLLLMLGIALTQM